MPAVMVVRVMAEVMIMVAGGSITSMIREALAEVEVGSMGREGIGWSDEGALRMVMSW
jgi:hypothetical protein